MNTRRSPRNQERLWCALTPPAAPVVSVPAPRRCFDCVNYPRGGRSRGHCTLRGVMVAGRTVEPPCWQGRAAAEDEGA
jgi:hypothetical protein